MTTTIDAQAVRNLIGRVIGRTCEPGADHEAYQLADIARRLVADNERLLAERDDLVEHQRMDRDAVRALRETRDNLVTRLKRISDTAADTAAEFEVAGAEIPARILRAVAAQAAGHDAR